MSGGGNGRVRSRGAHRAVPPAAPMAMRVDGYEEGFANGLIAGTASGSASTNGQPTMLTTASGSASGFFTGKCYRLGDGSGGSIQFKRSLEEPDGGTQKKKVCLAPGSTASGSAYTQGSASDSPDLPTVDVNDDTQNQDEDLEIALKLSLVSLEAEQRSIFAAGFDP
jgi:hypothetical protein